MSEAHSVRADEVDQIEDETERRVAVLVKDIMLICNAQPHGSADKKARISMTISALASTLGNLLGQEAKPGRIDALVDKVAENIRKVAYLAVKDGA